MTRTLVSRRTVLKGLGTAIALPWLESLTPAVSLGATAATAAPKRLAFIYLPNGMHMPDWTPKEVGKLTSLPYILEPLQPCRQELMVLSGLTLDKARPHGDGPGDHARAMATFLTGCQPRKTHGADIKVGISADQVAAQKLGRLTKFPSLELGCEGGKLAGSCDSGYSCAYSSNISWRSDSMPNAKEVNPRLVFERLFSNQVKGEVEASRAKRERYQASILDFVAEDANRLKMRLGATDLRKMDEYLTALREIEVRITRAGRPGGKGDSPLEAKGTVPFSARPTGIPKDYEEHLRLMCDLTALAFRTDLTRVVTLVFANDGSNRSYRAIGVPEGHHDLSHHGRDQKKQEKIRQINRFHISQLAYLLGKLKAAKEGDHNLLDTCMVVYGSGISDGNRHNHDELPILLAGKGGGTLSPGRHIRYPHDTPLMNLYLSLLERAGAPVERLGDSTGKLPSL